MVSKQTLKKCSEIFFLPFGKQSFGSSDTCMHLLYPGDCGLCTSILLKEFLKDCNVISFLTAKEK